MKIAAAIALLLLPVFSVSLSAQSREEIILSGGRGAATPTPTPTPPRPTHTPTVPRPTPTPSLTVAEMKGSWTAALSGVTGCGVSTLSIEFTLDAQGKGTQTASTEHTAACGDLDNSGLYVELQSLNPDGSGFIAFGCGVGCGFGFTIQVAHSRELFNMAPQPVSGNYLAGVAIRK